MPKKKQALCTEQEVLIQDAEGLVAEYPSVPLTIDCAVFGFDEKHQGAFDQFRRRHLQGRWGL